MSGGEAASFCALRPAQRLVMVIASPLRAGAEQGLAVIAAEQEDEPVQVLAQLAGVVGGVADERFAVNLREQREIQGTSQAELARQMKERGWSWHPQTVQRVEGGHRKVTIGEAQAIAAILRTTADRLTWPGQAASVAALLETTAGRAYEAWEQITAWASSLLYAQHQLAITLSEVEGRQYLGSDKIQEIVHDARQAKELAAEDAVKAARQEHNELLAAVRRQGEKKLR